MSHHVALGQTTAACTAQEQVTKIIDNLSASKFTKTAACKQQQSFLESFHKHNLHILEQNHASIGDMGRSMVPCDAKGLQGKLGVCSS